MYIKLLFSISLLLIFFSCGSPGKTNGVNKTAKPVVTKPQSSDTTNSDKGSISPNNEDDQGKIDSIKQNKRKPK